MQLDAFVVTGSNIRRVDAETALPVTVIEPVDLDARGTLAASSFNLASKRSSRAKASALPPTSAPVAARLNAITLLVMAPDR